MKIERYIDHTKLNPDAIKDDIVKLCNEAKEYNFKSVCINPQYVKLCKELLKNTETEVCTVIGFPLGANTMEIKVKEAEQAIEDGASEIDMVINISKLKDKDYDYVLDEIKQIVDLAGENIIVKVIIETCLLEDFEKEKAAQLIMEAGADFVKTSTGFSKSGADVNDIKLLKKVVGDKIKIKASGGIRNFEAAKEMIDAGADRIGASSGIKIVEEIK